MRITRRLLIGTLLAIAVLVAGLVYWVQRASQQIPEFYAEAIERQPESLAEAGDELEREVLKLHNTVGQVGRWEATFSDERVNGWLAVDLPQKFASTLPRGVSDPRVAINPEAIQVACRYHNPRVNTVVSMALEVQLTEEPNVAAVRIRNVRAGMLPLPFKNFLDQITKKAQKADLDLRWMQVDGDPVALIRIPARHEQYRYREIRLDTLELRDGSLYLSGITDRAATASTAQNDSATTRF